MTHREHAVSQRAASFAFRVPGPLYRCLIHGTRRSGTLGSGERHFIFGSLDAKTYILWGL